MTEEAQPILPPADGGEEAADLHIPAPRKMVKPRGTIVYPIPLEDRYVAQLLLPADLKRSEMLRLRRLLWSLAVPWAQ